MKRIWLTGLALIALLFVAGNAVADGNMEVIPATIAPVSTPVDGTVAVIDDMAVMRMAMHWDVIDPLEVNNPTLDQLVIDMNVDADSYIPADGTEVAVYYELQDDGTTNDGIFGNGEPQIGTATLTGGTATVTFALVTLNQLTDTPNGGFAYFYVTLDLTNQATTTEAVDMTVTVTNAQGGNVNNSTPTELFTSSSAEIDDYELTVTATPIAAGDADSRVDRGEEVTVLEVEFTVLDTTLSATSVPTVSGITLTQTGTAIDGDFASSGVVVYRDNNADDIYNSGDTLFGSADVVSGVADVTFSTPMTISTGAATAKVAVTNTPSAGINRTVGFEISDPSSDITFADGLDDASTYFLDPTLEFDQIGYVTSATSTPAAPGSYVISEFVEPQVAATSPANGAIVIPRTTDVTVIFNEDMDPTTVTATEFSLVEDPAGAATPVSGSFAFDGTDTITFTPDALLTYGETYEGTVDSTVEDIAGNTLSGGDYTFTFTVDPTEFRAITSTPPSGGVFVSRTTDIDVIFSSDVDIATAIAGNMTVVEDPDGSATPVSGSFAFDGTTTFTFTPDALLTYGAEYEVTLDGAIANTDGSLISEWSSATGGDGDDYDFRFTIDPTEFRVSSSSPPSGAVFVSRTTDVQVVFSDDVNAATAIDANFDLVEDPDGAATSVAGVFSFDDPSSTITFTPSALLTYGAVYEVVLDGNIANEDGSLLSEWSSAGGGDYTYRFTIDPTEFRVSSSLPVPNMVYVNRTSDIEIVFNDDVADATAIAANFDLVEDPDGAATSIAGAFSFDDPSSTITFNPTDLLAYGTEYEVVLAGAIANEDGSLLSEWSSAGGGDYSYRFTTDPTEFRVSSSSPFSGQIFVARTTDIEVVFNADVNEATAIDANFDLVEDPDGAATSVAGAFSFDDASSTITFSPTNLLTYGADYEILLDGNIANEDGSLLSEWSAAGGGDYTYRFSVDPTEFRVSSRSPEDGQGSVDRTSDIVVVFNDDVADATAIAANFDLVADPDGAATVIAGAFTFDDPTSTITFDPTALLDYGEEYEVTLSGSIANEAGSLLSEWTVAGGGDYSYRFTVDPTEFRVSSTTPADSELFVDRTSNVVVVFNDDVAAATAIAGNFDLIEDPDGAATSVAGAFSFDDPTSTMTFNPTTLLTYGAEYEVVIDGVVANEDGSLISEWGSATGGDGDDYAFRFTVDPTEFRVASRAPDVDETAVTRTSNIVVVFSDDVAAATAVVGNFSLVEDPDGAATSVAGSFSFDDPTSTITFNPTALLTYGETYEVTLDGSIANEDGSLLSEWSGAEVSGHVVYRFTVDPTEFGVASAAPAAAAGSVSRNLPEVIIVFNDVVAGSEAANEALFELIEDPAGTPSVVPGTFAFDLTSTFTFDPDSPLSYETTYQVRLAGAIANTDTSALSEWTLPADWTLDSGDYTYEFTVETPSTPFVPTTLPEDGDEAVAIESTVVVVFSEAMVQADVEDPANVYLTDGDGATVAGTLAYDGLNFTLTFTPDELLAYRETYTLTIDGSVEDLETSTIGESYAGDFTMSFATENEWPEFSEPIVTNNRLSSSSTEPVRVFVIAPTAEQEDDEVVVQVFTATGSRVATLTAPNTTFGDLGSQNPIEWFGENGRGQDLGPGLYFIQVSSGDYRRAMRIVIVR